MRATHWVEACSDPLFQLDGDLPVWPTLHHHWSLSSAWARLDSFQAESSSSSISYLICHDWPWTIMWLEND